MANFDPPVFQPGQLERICQALADTNVGLKGSEISRILEQIGVTDIDPSNTKWRRLFNALANRQNKDKNGGKVLSFIKHALEPSRFLGRASEFESHRRNVNGVLSFHGLEFQEDGKFHRITASNTLSEAEQRAGRLRAALSSRGAHPDVVSACRAELLEDNIFHAVLEATKSVADKLQRRCGLTTDGARLADDALGGESPRLRINALTTASEKSEQSGFCNLVKGLFGVFRNPSAHVLRTSWPMTEEDALDLFTLASYVHRRIDNAVL